jgi:arsenical pump membrane protein
MNEAGALVVLAACLFAALARPRWAPDWVVALAGAGLLLLGGVLRPSGAHTVLRQLGPTLGFLAALLVLADGCARAGLFDAVGAAMARGSGGRPRRLLALVFAGAGLTTAVLSLDATVLLLTPVVFVTAQRLRLSARPHVYACSHLANSASLLLPVSNLTNLLAFSATGVSFLHFAGLMALPWLAALAVEWIVLTRAFAGELSPGTGRPAPEIPPVAVPRLAAAVVAATLAAFAFSSVIGIGPVWAAAAGALALCLAQRPSLRILVRAVQPGFLAFVLGLALVVHAASVHGLASGLASIVPRSSSLPALLAIAAIAALAANLLNNLPATLVLLPVVAAGGRDAVLAMLIGVGAGPNLTYVGSLATLLWRRVLHAHDEDTDVVEFVRLGALTVPAVLVASTLGLWLASRVL